MTHRTIESILLDNSFYEWYLQTDPIQVDRWNAWRTAADHNSRLIDDAVYALHVLTSLRDEEGHPRPVHAVQIRMQQAREKALQQTDVELHPSNKAEIPDQHIEACLID